MKAVVQRIPGDHKSLVINTIDIPVVNDREILIKVEYASLNRLDLLQAKSQNHFLPKGASPILGVEVSGTIVAIGSISQYNFNIGDSVMALLLGGGYAEYCVCDERTVIKTLPGISLLISAAIPEAFITAYQLLFIVGKLQPGESVLIHAAASSIGQAAIQLAYRKGIKVFATTRTIEKSDVCTNLGAYKAYTLTATNFAEEIIKDNHGKPVDVVLDPVGSDYLTENLEVLSIDGRWVLYGLLSGGVMTESNFLSKLMGKRISLIPTTLRTRSFDYKHNIIENLQSDDCAFQSIISGDIKINIDRIYDFKDVQDAHDYMSNNSNIGKIVLRVSN